MILLNFNDADIQIQLYLFSFACYLSMVMAGVATAWPSPLIAWYSSNDSEVPMTEQEVSWMVSLVALGAGAACVPASLLADRCGRKTVLLATGLSSAFSWMLITTTRSKWALYCAQILGGVVLGGAPSVAPIYISEISPPKFRGAIVGQLNTMIFLGETFVYAVGPHLDYTTYTWVCSSVPLLFFVTFIYAPETPYYLVSKGRDVEARESMKKLRGRESLNELEAVREQIIEKDSLDDLSIWQALKKNSYMKHLICLQILSGVNQFNGNASLPVYAMEFLGGKWVTLEMGILFLVSSFFAEILTEPFGHRQVFTNSLIGTAISTFLIAVNFLHRNLQQRRFLLYMGLFGFCFLSSVGITPFILILPSGLFPTRLRWFVDICTRLTSSIACFLCLKIFVDVNANLGIAANFVMYSVISMIGVGVVRLIPETAYTIMPIK